MKIVIPGGSGQVGTLLARAFTADGHDVVVLSRRPDTSNPWRVVVWDAVSAGDWATEIDGADVVINMAGRSVNCRYTPENRREIKQSRIDSVNAIAKAIAIASRPPQVWLQAATATIYAHRFDAPNDEATGIIGGSEPNLPDTWRFSLDVATSWEKALEIADTPKTRKVALRSAIVMSPDHGGAFDTLLGLVRHGLGGTDGSGRQYVSWIHGEDFVRSIRFLIEREDFAGPVNLCAPNPLPNRAFMAAIRDAWGIKFGLPAANWMLEIGAVVLTTETELILKSRRVIPGRMQEAGFTFDFPTWPEAAADLVQYWRDTQQSVPPSSKGR